MKKILIAALTLFLCSAASAQQFADPCNSSAKVAVPISQSTSLTLFNGAAGRKNYICSVVIFAADAQVLSLVEGTGTVCAASTAAVIGGTTASAGLSFAAKGGFVAGSGSATVAAGATANRNACLLQSATGQVSGVITYVQQ